MSRSVLDRRKERTICQERQLAIYPGRKRASIRNPELAIRDQENRTSFPGSISKSRLKESDVFGLMISSMNFT